MTKTIEPTRRHVRSFIRKKTREFNEKLTLNVQTLLKRIKEQKKVFPEVGKVYYPNVDHDVADFMISLGYKVHIDNYLDYDMSIEWGPNIEPKKTEYL